MSTTVSPVLARLQAVAPVDSDVAVRAPGRANLIGEYTDINEGFVLPVAIEAATFLLGRRRNSVLRLVSLEEPGEVMVDLESGDGPQEGWGRYATAIVRALREAGVELAGFDGVVGSEVPRGAGLSSSHALEVAISLAVLVEPLPPIEIAKICRRAENAYVGVQSGIMDPLASAGGQAGHALLIDCRSLSVEPVPVPDGLRVVVVDSGVKRELASSAYNERREQCQLAARSLGVASLRDADLEMLEENGSNLMPLIFRRARHIVTENERTLEAAEALREGDLGRLRGLFAASHRSMAEDFEISTPELDTLVSIATDTPGVIAARLTGGGFGGSSVNLVERERADAAANEILDAYRSATGREGRAWITAPGDGAARIR